MQDTDRRFMALALGLGRRGQGNAWPNPAVGCVLVKDGRIIGRGWTAPGGRPHAETQALAQAGAAAAGATAYVTLEPCAHHGQTPPCAAALVAAGVARVVVATRDDDPRVSGRGLQMLRDAGINVQIGVLEAEAQADLAGFFKSRRHGLPFLTLKLASSFDGRIATATGESQWITGPQARHHVHGLRLAHDAVMVGAGTARSDDPLLNVRGFGQVPQPVRVVLSRRLDLPLNSRLAHSAGDVPLWLCHGPDADAALVQAWQGVGARLFECPVVGAHLAPHAVLQALATAGLTRVFCEGGSALAAALLAEDLVDQLVGYTAGLVIGAEGFPGIGAMGLDRLGAAARFQLHHSQALGGDVVHIWARSP